MDCWNVEKSHLGEWGFPSPGFESDFHEEPDFWLDFYAGRTWPNERALAPQNAVIELRFGRIGRKGNSPNLPLDVVVASPRCSQL